MKIKGISLCFILAFCALSGNAFAQEIDSVVIATESNYPDALVASVAAEKIGAPLLLTETGTLSNETSIEIASLNITSIYVIGGPDAIAQGIEDDLGSTYEIVRLWGMTRYGTAVAIADYFWEESEKAVLVWDALSSPTSGNSEMIAQSKEIAIDEEAPLLLISKEFIPEQVESILVNLSVSDVILIGNVGELVKTTLEELGIGIGEEIKGETPNETRTELKDKIKNRTKDRVSKGKNHLVVVAVGNWTDTIKAPYMPNGTSRHISSQTHVTELIEEINENNFSRIMIVGKPVLARRVHNLLAEAGIDATLLSGRPLKVAKEVMQRQKAEIKSRAKNTVRILRNLYQGKLNALNVSECTRKNIENVNAILTRLNIANNEQVIDRLYSLRDEMLEDIENGEYKTAWLKYKKIQQQPNSFIQKYKTRLSQEFQKIQKVERTYRNIKPIKTR